MKAMILAAGKGTRLRPITDILPKALVEIAGITLLERAISSLKVVNVDEIVVNVHHHADRIEDFLQRRDFGVRIHVSDEREKLLDTGGALKKATPFLSGEEPFFVHNVDVISNISLSDMLTQFQSRAATALLAVHKRTSHRQLCFNESGHLVGWKNRKSGELRGEDAENFAFSGIQLLDPQIFEYMPKQDVFSLVDLYLDLTKHRPVLAYEHKSEDWMEVGTPDRLEKAIHFFQNQTRV